MLTAATRYCWPEPAPDVFLQCFCLPFHQFITLFSTHPEPKANTPFIVHHSGRPKKPVVWPSPGWVYWILGQYADDWYLQEAMQSTKVLGWEGGLKSDESKNSDQCHFNAQRSGRQVILGSGSSKTLWYSHWLFHSCWLLSVAIQTLPSVKSMEVRAPVLWNEKNWNGNLQLFKQTQNRCRINRALLAFSENTTDHKQFKSAVLP